MGFAYAITNFLGGLFSKRAQGQFDKPDYRTALNECLNGFPIEQGAWTRRPGFRLIGTTRNGSAGRLIPFDFRQSVPYNMEFTDGYLRFWDGPNQASTNDFAFLSSVSTATPAVATISAARTWATGDRARFYSGTAPAPLLQNREFTLTQLTTTTFSLADGLTGDPIDGSLIGALDPSTIIYRIQEIVTPYTGTLWQALRSVQTEKKAVLLSSLAPYVLSQLTDPVFSEFVELAQSATFALAKAAFTDGPYLDPVSTADKITRNAGTIANLNPQIWLVGTTYVTGDVVFYAVNGENYISTANGNVGNTPGAGAPWTLINPGNSSTMHLTLTFNVWSSTQAYAKGDYVLRSSTGWISLADGNQNRDPSVSPSWWVAAPLYSEINAGVGFETTDVGRSVRFFVQPKLWDIATNYSAGDVILYGLLTYQNIFGSSTGQQPDTNPSVWRINPTAQQWTWGVITSRVSAGEVVVQIKGVPLLFNLPIRTWRLGAYSDTTGYPTCGTYHEGRLWLSGAVANRIDGGNPDDIFDFSPTNYLGVVADSNAISYTFDAAEVNTIFSMATDSLGIICCTPAGEWLVQASANNNILTPTSIQAHRVTKNGCENIEPRRTGATLIVVQRFGRNLLEYFADVFSGKFSAQNIAFRARSLFSSTIEEIAYQNELTPIIWARCGDGTLAGCTYKRESVMSSQPPNFFGWHRHTLGSGRTIESICVGPSLGGDLDTLSMVTSDDTTRHVEILTDLYDENASLTTAWFLDDAILASSYLASGSNLIVNGLWLLNGKTVSVWAGGLDCGDFTVASGSVTIPFGDGAGGGTGGGLFTSSYVSSFGGKMQVIAGFNFTSRGQILRPMSPDMTGARAGPALGKKRRTHQFAALLEGVVTGSMKFGTDFSGTMRPATLTTDGGSVLSLLTPFSGVHWDALEDDYSFDGMMGWEITRPYPATVVAIEGFLETQDK